MVDYIFISSFNPTWQFQTNTCTFNCPVAVSQKIHVQRSVLEILQRKVPLKI